MHAIRTLIVATALSVAAGVPTGTQPNPYTTIEKWGQLPAGRTWGSTSAVDVAPDGHIWVAERCGANSCAGSKLAPILKKIRIAKSPSRLRASEVQSQNLPRGRQPCSRDDM